MRADAPGRVAREGAHRPKLDTPEDRAAALEDARAGVLAATTLASSSAKWMTICRYLAKFGLEPWPPSADKVVALGAALKAGAYKSAPTYFSLYRTVAVRQGHVIDESVAQAIRDMS